MVWQWRRGRGAGGRGSRSSIEPQVATGSLPATTEGRSAQSLDRGGSSPLADPAVVAGLRPIPSSPVGGSSKWPASDLVGVTPMGESIEIAIDGAVPLVLLVFLATRCDGCDEFWRGFRDLEASPLPASVSAVVVTRGPDSIDAAEVERAASGVTQVPVVMSDRAWVDYRVSGYPFLVLVDPVACVVIGETVGFGWPDVLSMVQAAG